MPHKVSINDVRPILQWSLSIILLLILHKFWRSCRRMRMMPPGPHGLPLLGNVLQVPTSAAWLQFTEWTKKYGPVFSLNLAGQPVVVLNTFKAANDLLERRSNIYSDRPRLIVASETLTGGNFLGFARYGPLLRKLRRATHEGFNQRAVLKYKSLQRREALYTTIRVMDSPGTWDESVNRMAISSILSSVYDWELITDANAPVVKKIFDVNNKITKAALPGAHLVEFIPTLNYLPEWMTTWKKDAKRWYDKETAMFTSFNNAVAEKKVSEGIINPCFVGDLLENQDKHKMTQSEMAWLSGIMFMAGAETTSAVLLYFFLAMTLYPEVKKKAQEELDRVVGRERPPHPDDLASLPYIQALVKEVMRWKPPVPNGMTHSVTEDNWYEGHLIPKGSLVISNIWAINRDPSIWSHPDEFRPERHLEVVPEGGNPLGHSAFGFGRRICVGMHFANQALGISLSIMLWALQIEPDLDVNGRPVLPPRDAFNDHGLSVCPKPFKCRVFPRFEKARDILEAEMKD